jgi:hypothetical protein
MQIVVTHMYRQNVSSVDEKGKPVTKEHLTYKGEARITDYRGVLYAAEFEIGKYHRPNIVTNTGQRYHQETGQPLLPEKILSGQKLIYDAETEITDKNRKKLIDLIIGDNHPETISVINCII